MRHKLKQKQCNFEVTEILKRHNYECALDNPLFLFMLCTNIFVLKMQIEAQTTQLRNMRRKLKQKRRNFEITEI